MAFANSSKSNLLSALLIKIIVPFLLLQSHNVKSQQSSSPLSQDETVSFGFTHFEHDNPDIFLTSGASVSGGVLRLTKTDQLGKPIPKSVGKAVHLTPVHIWDKNSGELADFSTGFSFVVNTGGSTLHGDGFAFFMAPIHLDLSPANSSGGYLGLFSPQTALDISKTKSWLLIATAGWPIEFVPGKAVGEASINYNSESKRLSVFVAYPGTNLNATVSAFVDLRTFLPEWVRVGFSAATGELVETHDILNWSFEAAL
ncbi:Legume lectin, alpha chain, conserved site [Sesbania bispinosa]|nr:Legume lectin, alpha chain, conserved site [Sesbania bispinosa]